MTCYPANCTSRYTPAASWNRVMDSLLNESLRAPAASRLRYDVYSDKQNYYVDVELPGVKKQNVQVNLEGDTIHVQAQYTEEETKLFFIRRERPVGKVEQSFRIGKNLDAEKMEARFEDGLLHLTVPVREEASGRNIAVQ